MGWFWADRDSSSNSTSIAGGSGGFVTEASCPLRGSTAQANSTASGCPIIGQETQSKCPIKGDTSEQEVLNPMNNMPMDLSSERAPGQKITLSTDRTISLIPRGTLEDQGLWEYPSPQQMLNAMRRKGKGDGIPEDAVESMVEVHNFLNEGAWQQILDWERKYTQQTKVEPRLLKFTGRPNDLSPRAAMYLGLGKIFPETFNTQPPFDRHDWTVLRSLGKENGWREVRYVIDYYSAPDDDESGMPAFLLDTRPALDSPLNACDRFNRWFTPLWSKAMGKFDE